MKDKFYKVKIYSDNRILITLHDFNPNPIPLPLPSSRPDSISLRPPSEYMSTKDYRRLLKTTHRKLWDLEFEEDKCVFVTLTLKEDMDYEQLNKEFHRFFVYVKRKYGKFEYIRAIELQEKTLRYHIHCILQFKSIPMHLDTNVIEKLWGLGVCDFQRVFDLRGVLQYITKFKDQHEQKDNPNYTCFLRGSKIISTSQHFGKQIDSSSCKEIYISEDQLTSLLNYHFKKFENEDGKFVRVDEHLFFNHNTGRTEKCWDRVFIRSTQEFVDNNLTNQP